MINKCLLEVGERVDSQLISCIRDSLYTCGDCSKEGSTLPEQITTILSGTKKTRLGNSLSPECRKYNEGRISRWVNIGAPIEIISLWGALKGYGQFKGREDADIMDLIGIRRFEDISKKVQAIYPPGINVKILREDVGEVMLTGNLNLPCSIGEYSRNLDNICSALGVDDHISFVDESSLLASKNLSKEDFLLKARENSQYFFEYWLASQRTDPSGWESLPEYEKLLSLGWKGVIPPVMREHYIGRSRTEIPLGSDEILATRVCLYLGTALTRYQCSLYSGEFRDANGTIPPLKASFVPYPPGTDSSLMRGRFEYKVKDSKGNNSVPPWAGFGFMVRSDPSATAYEPSIIGVRKFRDLSESDFSRVNGLIKGEKCSAGFRADILLRGVN